MADWMLYGATGYTGRLIVEEAVRCGQRPVIAGRSAEKLRALAAQYDLDYVALDLQEPQEIVRALRETGVRLVLHAAGPFIETSAPMQNACLEAQVHYLDITGEIPVFENTFAHDQQAKARGIVLISGVGFDVVPSDCLIRYAAEKLPDAVSLEIALDALSGDTPGTSISAGTTKSLLHMLAKGNRVRRGGTLVYRDLGADSGRFPMPHGERTALAIPWGDLSTGYRTSGIPNITTYLAMPPAQIEGLRRTGHLVHLALGVPPLRNWLLRQVDRTVQGPTEQQRQTGRSYIYVRVRSAAGEIAQAWLETAEGYHFTAQSALLCIARVLENEAATPPGAWSPAQAFGRDFVLEIEGTRRYDHL
jgi:short subunit dehydrogenase-like uncharacterized protein